MSPDRRPRVAFVTRILPRYRIPFHERVRAALADRGVDYALIHGQPNPGEAAKGDCTTLPWATRIRNRSLLGRDRLIWQPILRAAWRSDLMVLGQENRLLVNYLLQSLPGRLRPRIALWGHGPNFQAVDRSSPAERWRRHWAPRCDWWFAYSEASRAYVEAAGFPSARITVFNNAIDTRALHDRWRAVTPAQAAQRRATLGLTGGNVGIYVGAMYDFKRIAFLIESADLIRAAVPDFELLLIGSGVDAGIVADAARTRPWMHALGPRFGGDKAELMRLAQVFLMPGLLGLAVLDATATGLPVVTTDDRHHSPEIAYLEDGVSGVVVRPWDDPRAYAEAVIALLGAPARLAAMAGAALRVAHRYTIDAMADRFVGGVLAALQADKR